MLQRNKSFALVGATILFSGAFLWLFRLRKRKRERSENGGKAEEWSDTFPTSQSECNRHNLNAQSEGEVGTLLYKTQFESNICTNVRILTSGRQSGGPTRRKERS